ncbi:DNA primase [Candidatus Ecksteinia adelgidicola]|nr:DNA primase [Candidatus Ecksteinia adelgidicola]
MTERISRLFINDLLVRTEIVNLINRRIKLKKKGKNFYAYCPFHHEKTPSFTVNSEKQFFYCFGCGIHGNVIDFLMNYDKINFIETIQELANIHGLEIPYKSLFKQDKIKKYQKKNLYQLMEQLSIFYQNFLYKPSGILARQYLKTRGFDDKIIHYFNIGFSPNSWNSLLNIFGKDIDMRSALHDVGMLVTTSNKKKYTYDRFRERLMFPIRDQQGRVIGFGGRNIHNDTPKYLNSPETKIFKKSQQLYGLYEALKNNSVLKRILIVEGYMDVIALAQYGINYSTASLGTSTTSEHIQLLFRNTDHVICCYDGDQAGRNAAWRTLKRALPHLQDGRQLQFMFLPDSEDPDTLIRKEGKIIFEKRIQLAQPFSTFLFRILLSKVDLSSLDGRTKLSLLAIPIIKKIPSQTLRLYLRQILGKKLGIPDEFQLEKLIRKKNKNINFYQQPQLKRTIMRVLIGLLVQNPKLAILIPSLKELEDNQQQLGLPLFLELVKICLQYPKLRTGELLELYRNKKIKKQLEILTIWDHMIDKDKIEQFFLDTLNNLYCSLLERKIEILIAQSRTNGLNQKEREQVYILNKLLSKKKINN